MRVRARVNSREVLGQLCLVGLLLCRIRDFHGGVAERDVKPLPTKPQGKRSAYGQAPRGVNYRTSVTNGRGTGRRSARGGRATWGIAHARHNIVSAEILASEEPRTVRAGSTALRCRFENGHLIGSECPAQVRRSVWDREGSPH